MANIRVRDMTPEDWKRVKEIYEQGIQTNLATFETVCPAYEQWDKNHLPVCRFAAECGSDVIGWAVLSPVSSRCVYKGVAEVSIYIDNAYQGKGVGRMLLEKLIESSEREGFWTLVSGIFQDNIASIRLHEACGFRMVGYREKIGQDRLGEWRNTVMMERRSGKIL